MPAPPPAAPRHSPPADARHTSGIVLVGLLAVSLLLRSPIAAVPPALEAITTDLGLTPTTAGFATTLPLVCFGVFAFVAPALSTRVGSPQTIWVAVALLGAGVALRSLGAVAAFFVGITLIGLGIAIGNVMVPAVVRAEFPTRMASVMGRYTVALQVGAAAGAAATAPLMSGLGWSWQAALGIWLVLVLVILLVWSAAIVSARRSVPPGEARRPAVPTRLAAVARRRRTWGIVVVMGGPSLVFYSLLTWLPTQLTGYGISRTSAGFLLALFTLLGIPGSFLGPRLVGSPRGGWGIVALLSGYAVGVLGLLAPGTAVAGVILCGLCQGPVLSVSLTFIAHQRDAADVPAVSALAQGVGYLVAATGPAVLGSLFGSTGSWLAADLLLVALLLVVAVTGSWVARTEAGGR